MNEKEFIQRLSLDNSKFYGGERGRGALRDLQQTFPHSWLYVAELLQNAVDAGATRIRIETGDDSLILEHDGKQFDQKDVEAICSRGVSAKGPGTIGFMGVGFKSVFRSFKTVQISSGPWRFKLHVSATRGEEFGDTQRDWLGAVLPSWDDETIAESSGMRCRFLLSGRIAGLEPNFTDLEHVIGKDQALLALLAWRGVEEFWCNGEHWLLARSGEMSIDENRGQRVILEALDSSVQRLHRWILFSAVFKPSKGAIKSFLEHRQINPDPEEKEQVYNEASRPREVVIFCDLTERNTPIPVSHGSAFALLPTGVTFPLGVHVQADWLLVISRRELMQIEGNEWHEEILQQVPRLLRYYLEWLVAIGKRGGDGWQRGYDALPDDARDGIDSDLWFTREVFQESLRFELENIPWLPVAPGREGGASFLSPSDARMLPAPLARLFDDGSSQQRILFGDCAVSAHLLGKRAARCLKTLGLLHELAPDELVLQWESGVVGAWYAQIPRDEQINKLGNLLAALSEMDEKPLWKNAKLRCVPTDSGNWSHRAAVVRLPLDWQVLDQEQLLQQAFLPFVGSESSIITRALHNALLNPRLEWRTTALKYLDPITVFTLEEITEKFWSDLTETLSAEQITLILHFTSWVKAKQPQRKSLVRKILTVDEGGHQTLLPCEASLLAEPYAGEFRRMFFPGVPVVSAEYLRSASDSTEVDWRVFFESLSPPPRGAFSLELQATPTTQTELRKQGYPAPTRRSSFLRLNWRGLSITSQDYRLLDARLPSEASVLLQKKAISYSEGRAFLQWMQETGSDRLRRQFLEYKQVKLAYIPSSQSYVQEDHVNSPCSWIESLTNSAWVFAKNGGGPFYPRDVLASNDAARPDALVADLHDDLVRILQEAGIQFGTAVPNAPAVDRLRVHGPTSDTEVLYDLLREAIQEVGDDNDKSKFLKDTLSECHVFPLPSGTSPVDGATRVPFTRLVCTVRGRSSLGDWLVAIEAFEDNSGARKVFDLVDQFRTIPTTCSVNQVMDFLSWVWATCPDADSVRTILPRTYQYLREDLESDSAARERWNGVRSKAMVFVSQRRWVSAAGNDNVFLDDKGLGVLGVVPPEVQLATPGHLGQKKEEQLETASLLGLRLLSSRYRLELQLEQRVDVPTQWQTGFEYIQRQVFKQLTSGDVEQLEEDGNSLHLKHGVFLTLSRWRGIETLIFDGDQLLRTQPSQATVWDGTLAVSGEPEDFAHELCRVLFDSLGLRLRRDLLDFLPKIAILLTRIGIPETVNAWVESEQPSPDTPAEKDRSDTIRSNVGAQPAASVTDAGEKSEHIPKSLENNDTTEKEEKDPQGGSHTVDDRESQLENWIRRKKELERMIQESIAMAPLPPEEDDESHRAKTGEFRSDQKFREAASRFELRRGRFPVFKDEKQSGHDIDSFTHAEGQSERRLVRRIEVKGKGLPWKQDQTVEMSNRQFLDALNGTVEEESLKANDFDYWLYVVEQDEQGSLNVLPIRNPAHTAARYELRGGTWRNLVESTQEPEEPTK